MHPAYVGRQPARRPRNQPAPAARSWRRCLQDPLTDLTLVVTFPIQAFFAAACAASTSAVAAVDLTAHCGGEAVEAVAAAVGWLIAPIRDAEVEEPAFVKCIRAPACRLVAVASMPPVLFPSLATFITGVDGGVMSLAMMQLTSPDLVGANWGTLSVWGVGLLTSAQLYGAMAGSAAAFILPLELSSRDILFLAALLHAGAAVASGAAAGYKGLVLARAMCGFIEGFSAPAKIDYLTETCSAGDRGAAFSLRAGLHTVGALVGASIGAVLLPIPGAWRIMLGTTAAPALVMCAGAASLPHSPRWLMAQCRDLPPGQARSGAFTALMQLRGMNVPAVLKELKEISPPPSLGSGPHQGSASSGHSCQSMAWLRGVRVAAAVMLLIQANGHSALHYYKAQVLTILGHQNHVRILTALMMGVRVVSTPAGFALADWLGRRRTLKIGTSGMSLSMGLLAAGPWHDGILPLLCLGGHAAAYEVSFGPSAFAPISEVFPQSSRRQGTALAHMCNYAVKAIVVHSLPWFLQQYGTATVWTTFALLNAAGLFIVHHLAPETSGQSLKRLEGTLWQVPLARSALEERPVNDDYIN